MCLLQEAGLRPNVHVFSALVGRATRRLDFAYLKTMLKSMRNMSVWPNEVIIRQLEFASQYPPNYDKVKHRELHQVATTYLSMETCPRGCVGADSGHSRTNSKLFLIILADVTNAFQHQGGECNGAVSC